MISPELLRRYPFFGTLNDSELKELAMITEEAAIEQETVLFTEGQVADTLYFLVEGSIDLVYSVQEQYRPETRKDFLVGEINPGEVFAISTLIEPYVYTSTARAGKRSRVLKIDAQTLRDLLAKDCTLGYKVMRQIARAAIERLASARVMLADARLT
ncbi:MAG: Crp/Fnr family transcriptional regulator [Chloroflexota bacterium]